MSKRDEFPEEVKRALANRASHVCSNPRCMGPTSGPQEDPAKALNIGVAPHITAASPGGARYDDSLTPEQRKDARNGIWLCQNCAKLVDNDESQFPVEHLRAWKVMREVEARMNIGQTAPSRVESESERKSHEIVKWVGKQVMFVIPPNGSMEFNPIPVKLLNGILCTHQRRGMGQLKINRDGESYHWVGREAFMHSTSPTQELVSRYVTVSRHGGRFGLNCDIAPSTT
jgi:hypothetical protein